LSSHQVPWSSLVVLVQKKDGTIRFYIDYRKVNGVTVKHSYLLPRIDDCLDALSGSHWFCTLDLTSGYWQVEMDKDKRIRRRQHFPQVLGCISSMPCPLVFAMLRPFLRG